MINKILTNECVNVSKFFSVAKMNVKMLRMKLSRFIVNVMNFLFAVNHFDC